MDDNKDIEKVSKSVFDDHSMEPPVSAWSRLEGELNKKQAVLLQRKANNFKMLSLILSLFLCCFVTCHYLTPTSTFPIHSITQKTTEKKTYPSAQVEKQDPIKFTNPLPTEITNTTKEIETTSTQINSLKYNSKSATAILSSAKKKKSIRKTIDLTTLLSDSTIMVTNLENKTSTASPLSETTILTIPSLEENNEINIANDNQHTSNSISISSTPSDSISIDTVRQAILLTDANHAKRPRYSLSLYYTPGISLDYLKDKSNNQFDEVAMYKDREKSEYSFIAGINIHYSLNENWSIGSGISYSSLAKSMHLPYLYADANSEYQMHYMYSTSSGIIELPNIGPLQPNVGDTLFEKSNCRQMIRFINLPIQLRYQITKNKFTWFANAGLSANFIIQEKAEINLQSRDVTVINKVEGLKKVNYGFLIGVGASYSLKDNIDI